MSTTATADAVLPKLPLYGIGGWLALFIFGRFVVGFLSLGQGKLDIAMAIFGVIVAVLLYMKKPMALKATLVYLIGLLVLYSLFLICAVILLMTGDQTDNTMKFLTDSIRGVIFTAIWLAYFARSERVMNTYGVT